MRFLIEKGLGQSKNYFSTIPCLRQELVTNHQGEKVFIRYKKACGRSKSEVVSISKGSCPVVTGQDEKLFDWNKLELEASGQFYA